MGLGLRGRAVAAPGRRGLQALRGQHLLPDDAAGLTSSFCALRPRPGHVPARRARLGPPARLRVRHVLVVERGPGRDPGPGRHGPRRAAAARERERAAPELSVLLPRGYNVVRDITTKCITKPPRRA